MPSLASIPETSSTKYTAAKRPSAHSVASFERARPRSRVVVLSRHPTRVRKRFYQPLTSTDQSRQDGPNQPASGTIESPGQVATKSQGYSSKQAYVADDAVSEVSETSDHVYEPSEKSIDLNAFPLPPSSKTAWPLSDNVGQIDSSLQRLAIKDTRLQGPTHIERRQRQSAKHSFSTPISKDPAIALPRRNINVGPPPQSRKRGSVNPILVEAISKSVAEQLCLYSSVDGHGSPSKSTQTSLDTYKEPSRTPSQRQALQRYTKELQRYAKNVGAAGKVPIFTPTPSKSSATLRTVSALLPYRPEFRAAGLAVTSRDQAQRSARARAKTSAHRETRKKTRPPTASRFGGMDGKEDTVSLPSTEVDFMDPNNVDVWRRALVEHVPPRRRNTLLQRTDPSATGCLPCFSSKQANRDKHQFIVNTGVEDFNNRELTVKEAEYPVPGPWPERTKGLRPKGYTIPQTMENPAASFNYHDGGKMATYNEPAVPMKTLRRRSKTLAQLQSLAQLARERRSPPQSPSRVREGKSRNRGQSINKGQTALDSLPQQSSKLDLHRFAQRQYQSLPVNRLGLSPAEPFLASPYTPASNPRAASLPNDRKQSRRPPGNGSKTTKNKATMAALEIARHDCGPYPARVPRPRPSSGRSSRPPRIPSRKSSIRRLRSNRDDDFDFSSILDRDVLQGLRIATTAACDKRVDGLLHEKTGVHIRQFLAELIQFDYFSHTRPGETARERANRRRSQMKDLKRKVRKSREMRGEMPS